MWIIIVLIGLTALTAGGLLLKRRMPKAGTLLVCGGVVLAVAIGTVTAVCWSVPDSTHGDCDYAVLLGALLEEGEPTPELERRLQRALDWQKTDPHAILFVSGGDPEDQSVTEAQVMCDWLEAHGGDMSRIFPESRAMDTHQNLLYSRELAREMGLQTHRVLMITSEYHQTRAGFLARQLGQEPLHLSCETPFVRHLDGALREVFAFVKAILTTL